MKTLSVLKQSSLSLNEALVLAWLAENPESTQGEVSVHLALALSAVSQIMSKFKEARLIEGPFYDEQGLKRWRVSGDGLDKIRELRAVDIFSDVRDFRLKFQLPIEVPRGIRLSKDTAGDVAKCLREEVDEFLTADNDVDRLDALVDLIYFATGAIVRMNVDGHEAWRRVHKANMAKVPGRTKRGIANDVTKPEGWTAPDLSDLF